MKILYQMPSLSTLNAGRTIYHGYKNAFTELGHSFRPLTADDNFEEVILDYKPDIFFTGIHSYYFKYLNLDVLKKAKKKGLIVFVNTPFWHSPFKNRINEGPSLDSHQEYKKLISSGDFGDIYYNICEQGDPRMDGFEKKTGYHPYTILLAADKTLREAKFRKKFSSDIAYIGTYLPGKREFFKQSIFPLQKKYSVKLYGQDWTFTDRVINTVHKTGQYFNIPWLRSFKKPSLTIQEEREIYKSSLISINVHEDYQKNGLGDINERTFKIPLSGGFEVVDNVPSLKKYFKPDTEIVIAKNKKIWLEKIEYYLNHPEKRLPIIAAGKRKVLKYHTYHNRVEQILKIYNTIK